MYRRVAADQMSPAPVVVVDTLHIAPLLVCLAALATNTRLRTVALGSAALLVVLLAFHNSRKLAEALSFFASGMR